MREATNPGEVTRRLDARRTIAERAQIGPDTPTVDPNGAERAPLHALERVPRSPADHRVTIAQIGTQARMALGMRDWLHSDKRGELRCRIGMGAQTAQLIIVLGADDLYHVEFGRLRKPRGEVLPVWETIHVVRDLHCDVLGEALTRAWEHEIRR